jgi:hypothetical protein
MMVLGPRLGTLVGTLWTMSMSAWSAYFFSSFRTRCNALAIEETTLVALAEELDLHVRIHH